jgi:membrane peptidoglycan carboxypeptidase
MAQATTLYDQGDEPVFTIFKEQRIEVPLEKIGKTMREAVVSVEDQRFYQHNGIDLVRIGAAVVANARAGERAQGGSTITQQLARMSFLNRKKTNTRKNKEAFAALLIERTYTKDEILALYLNKAYFGDGYHGVEAASLGFLGKHADELDVPEAALIAGLIQSPSAYAPTINMEKAIARRNIVLLMMLDNGVIDRQAHDKARRARRTGSTSRSRSGANSSTASAGSACRRAASRSTRPSTAPSSSRPRRSSSGASPRSSGAAGIRTARARRSPSTRTSRHRTCRRPSW